MAVVATPTKNAVYMVLNNGTDPETGVVTTVRQSLGNLTENMSNYDDAKAMAIMEALAPCLTKSFYSAQRVTTNTLTIQQ